MNSFLFEVAIGLIPGIGAQYTKQLISHCGSAEKVFSTPKGKLLKIPGIGPNLAESILNQKVLHLAEKEILKAEKLNASILFYTHANYPSRLRNFADAPTLLYFKGNQSLNAEKIIGIVGTRNATSYGKEITDKIISDLKQYNPIIVSGLAYGIDIQAHKKALTENLNTIGVMASGIDIIYPSLHRETVVKMIEKGGILTEYYCGTKPDPSFFPARNRIVAGLCDAIIVVEAAKKGGALITAEIANNYNREVFAIPGNIGNIYNEGCNQLIKTHKAHIYTSIHDLEYILNWDIKKNPTKSAHIETLIGEEKLIALALSDTNEMKLDDLSWKTTIPINRLAATLLTMEFKGLIKAIPGKKFKLLT